MDTERQYAALGCTDCGQHRFSTQKGQRSEVEVLYPLVTAANLASWPEHATSLPSWSYGFDSRRPLSSSVRRLREPRQHHLADGGPFAPEAPDFLETEYRVKMKGGGVIRPVT
jgi:hypothetical protein